MSLRAALGRSAERHGPGLLGLVLQDGEVVFEDSVGVADLDSPRPLTADDQVRIGSVTKTYVTALVLQLLAEGVLAADETVEQWVPDGAGITVELLLRMRSGLPDYVGPVFGDPPDLSALGRYWSPQMLVRYALTGPDRVPPDQRYAYRNTDYVLLGLLVERATGERVEAQLWQRLFAPLGLDDTTFPTVDPHLRGQYARGYLRAAADHPYQDCTVASPSESWTAGGIVATPRDLARFFAALFAGRVLDADGLARMTTVTERLDDRAARCLGLVRYDLGGAVAYGHHGGVPGYTTMALQTEDGRTVVLCQNGLDAHDILTSDTPFVAAALS